MIEIVEDIEPFGFKIYKGSIVHLPPDFSTVTGSESKLLTIEAKDDNGNHLLIPVNFEKYNCTITQFLDELCFLHTGHDSYEDYCCHQRSISNVRHL